MANRFYNKASHHFDLGDIQILSNNIKAILVSAGYVPDTSDSGHEFLSSVGAGNIVATSANFTSKSDVGGLFRAANILFAAVSGAVVVRIVIYVDTGNAATSYLIGLIDTANNLPVTPNGSDITVVWDVTAGVYTL